MPIQTGGSPRALGKLPLASSSLGPPVQKQCKTLNPSLRQPFQGAEASSQSWISSQCVSSEHLLSILWTKSRWCQSPLLHEWIPMNFYNSSVYFFITFSFFHLEIHHPVLWVVRADSGGKGNLMKEACSPGCSSQLHCWPRVCASSFPRTLSHVRKALKGRSSKS